MNTDYPGYTMWARETLNSDIFFYKPDKWFKIWFYIVNRVNFKQTNLFDRGEALITYEEIMIATKATKPQVHKCIKFLEKENMTGCVRTTRGMVRKVNNYERYQDSQNYKDNSKTTTETTGGQLADNCGVLPIVEEGNNEIKKTLSRFEEFWKTYPNKKNKKKAEEKFHRLEKSNPSVVEEIFSALVWQKETEDWQKDGGKYIPHPTTYLNGERWNDSPEVEVPKGEKELIIEFNRIGFSKFKDKYGIDMADEIGNKIQA